MFSILNTEEFLLAETEGSEEEDKENDKAEETLNDSALENKSLQENEEEEIGNLELAWDMLDLAKIIFKRELPPSCGGVPGLPKPAGTVFGSP